MSRRCLYKWRAKLEAVEPGEEASRASTHAAAHRKEILQLMVASMSRPANPFDNASCESFMKTLKREEIYANRYRDLEHLHANVEEFIEQRRLAIGNGGLRIRASGINR